MDASFKVCVDLKRQAPLPSRKRPRNLIPRGRDLPMGDVGVGKIPVLQTIAETYAFAFRRYFQNLGVLWLPFLLIAAAAYYVLLPAMIAMVTFLADTAQHALDHSGTPYLSPALWPMLRGTFLFELLILAILPVIAVGITKEALQTRRGPWFVYLSIGKPELFVFGGFLTMIALYFGAVIGMAIVGAIVGIVVGLSMVGSSAAQGNPAAVIAMTTLVLVRVVMPLFYLVLAYFMIRLCFLMVPVSTAETRFGLWRGWALTKGNFWRSLGVILGTFLPITIASYALWYFVFGPALFEYMWDAQAHPQAAPAELGAQIQMFIRNAQYFGIYVLILAPINYGLMFGQSAFAYRALAGDKSAGPWER